jgi:hypothetical protein
MDPNESISIIVEVDFQIYLWNKVGILKSKDFSARSYPLLPGG